MKEKIYNAIGPNRYILGEGGIDCIMIGDVLERQMRNDYIYYEGLCHDKLRSLIVEAWPYYNLPIEEQDDYTKQLVNNLIDLSNK